MGGHSVDFSFSTLYPESWPWGCHLHILITPPGGPSHPLPSLQDLLP